jgi:type II secretory pathway component GspD/PulD (secretin)
VRTNLLFVTDLDARLTQIAELLASIDRPSRQVLIEARIVEGEQGFSRNLGVRLSLAAASADGGTATGLSGGKDGTLFDLSAGPAIRVRRGHGGSHAVRCRGHAPAQYRIERAGSRGAWGNGLEPARGDC